MSKLEILKTWDGNVYFRGISFSSYRDIERQMENADDEMHDIESKLKQLAIATPVSITPSGFTPIEYIDSKVADLMMDYYDAAEKRTVLLMAYTMINEYANKLNVDHDEAFRKCYIDKYKDLLQGEPPIDPRI
jgi:hypothetical protein